MPDHGDFNGSTARTRGRRVRDSGAAGFDRFELVSTLPGRPLYAALDYREVEWISIPLGDDVTLEAVRMEKP